MLWSSVLWLATASLTMSAPVEERWPLCLSSAVLDQDGNCACPGDQIGDGYLCCSDPDYDQCMVKRDPILVSSYGVQTYIDYPCTQYVSQTASFVLGHSCSISVLTAGAFVELGFLYNNRMAIDIVVDGTEGQVLKFFNTTFETRDGRSIDMAEQTGSYTVTVGGLDFEVTYNDVDDLWSVAGCGTELNYRPNQGPNTRQRHTPGICVMTLPSVTRGQVSDGDLCNLDNTYTELPYQTVNEKLIAEIIDLNADMPPRVNIDAPELSPVCTDIAYHFGNCAIQDQPRVMEKCSYILTQFKVRICLQYKRVDILATFRDCMAAYCSNDETACNRLKSSEGIYCVKPLRSCDTWTSPTLRSPLSPAYPEEGPSTASALSPSPPATPSPQATPLAKKPYGVTLKETTPAPEVTNKPTEPTEEYAPQPSPTTRQPNPPPSITQKPRTPPPTEGPSPPAPSPENPAEEESNPSPPSTTRKPSVATKQPENIRIPKPSSPKSKSKVESRRTKASLKPSTVKTKSKKSPKSLKSTKKSPKSLKSTKKSPKSLKSTKKSPKSLKSTKKSPKSVKSTKKSPKSLKSTKKSPKSLKSTKKSPKSLKSTKKSPKSLKSAKKSPKSLKSTKKSPKSARTGTKAKSPKGSPSKSSRRGLIETIMSAKHNVMNGVTGMMGMGSTKSHKSRSHGSAKKSKKSHSKSKSKKSHSKSKSRSSK